MPLLCFCLPTREFSLAIGIPKQRQLLVFRIKDITNHVVEYVLPFSAGFRIRSLVFVDEFDDLGEASSDEDSEDCSTTV